MKFIKAILNVVLLSLLAAALCGCAANSHLGMIKDADTGLMYGSNTSGNFVFDPVQFKNPVVKVKLRNTSGDPAIDMKSMRGKIEDSLKSKGYGISNGTDFGIKLDINLVYSGQFSRNRAIEYGLIGAGIGGYTGYREGGTDGTVIGTVSGATAGAIFGSYSTQDTYLMVADVVLGIMGKPFPKKETMISFGDTHIEKRSEHAGFRHFTSVEKEQVAVYAGGSNVKQNEIINGVTARLERILKDIM